MKSIKTLVVHVLLVIRWRLEGHTEVPSENLQKELEFLKKLSERK